MVVIGAKHRGRHLSFPTKYRRESENTQKKEARPGLLDVGNSKKIWRKSARVKERKRNFPKLFIKRREYMANNWADDSEELPPLGTLSKDESTKTTSTPTPSAEKSTYVPPHLRNRQGSGGGGDFGRRNDFGGRRDYRGRLL